MPFEFYAVLNIAIACFAISIWVWPVAYLAYMALVWALCHHSKRPFPKKHFGILAIIVVFCIGARVAAEKWFKRNDGPDCVYVVGEVIKPGSVVVPAQGRLTASKAIAASGGFDRFANQRDVLLLRDSARTTLDLEAILAGKAEDPVLKPNDMLMVSPR